MTPNLTQAQSFLTALDEDSDAFCFQTFDDSGKDKSLIRQRHGSFDKHADELASLNERGAGIFVTVNETNMKGRTKRDIERIRALFVDLDGAPLEPVIKAATQPHIVVQTSPGRFHAYWRVNDCPVDECEPALKELIGRFNADPSCCDRSRVLRLPGFFHCKADPYLVQVIESDPGEYSMTDFAFMPTYRREQRMTEVIFSALQSSSVGVPPACLPESEGQRNKCLFQLARHLKGTMPQASRDELRAMVQQWHRLALPVIGTKDFAQTWADFLRGWDKVQFPHGETLSAILKGMDMGAMPESITALGYGEKCHLLIRICRQLQRNNPDGPFFLSARQAGELVEIHFTDAAKYLYALASDGVLEITERGSGKKASRYKYIWPD